MMSSSMMGEEQQLPIEIWVNIIDYCFWIDPQHHSYSVRAASRVNKRILSLTSRWFRELMGMLVPIKRPWQDPLFPGSVTSYCSSHGYVSLLKYAVEQGAVVENTTATEAARFGHVDCLKVIDESGCDLKIRKRGLEEAAKYGQLHSCVYYIDSGVQIERSTIENAVMSGSVELVEFLQSTYYNLGHFAARSGSLAMVKYIQQYWPLDPQCIEGSAYSGSIEILEYLLDNGVQWDGNDTFTFVTKAYGFKGNVDKFKEYVKFAVQRGAPVGRLLSLMVENKDLEMLRALADLIPKKLPWNGWAMERAAKQGNLEIMQCLVAICGEDGIRQVKEAAERGHVDCVKYLIEKGALYNAIGFGKVKSEPVLKYLIELFRGSSELTIAAVKAMNLEGLKFLHENGCQWPQNIIDYVTVINIRHPNQVKMIAIIEYLRQQGCEWTAQACANAARDGVVDVLKYLHENGCPWDEHTAASAKNTACLIYALKNGCPCNYEAIDNAARSFNLDALKLVFERGIHWNKNTLTRIAEHGYLSMLKYAHENGAQWETDTIYAIIRRHAFESFEYAIANGCPWDPQLALQEALNSENNAVIKWIQNNTQQVGTDKAPEKPLPVPSSNKKPDEKCCIS